jgi:gluconate 5-dehydrogenase
MQTEDLRGLFQLQDRVALVTGAPRGIGWEIARALGANGAHVVLNGRDRPTLDERVETLQAAGARAEAAAFDVADHDALIGALGTIMSRHGSLDVVFVNVGHRIRRPTAEVSHRDFAGLLDVNLVAAYDLSREAALLMAEAGRGSIILMSSIAASRGSAGNAAYATSKAGLEALTRCLAVEFGPLGVRTNAIAPGAFATESNAQLKAQSSAERRVPLRRWGDPQECAGPALFLASDASSYVNGHVLVVDGGLSIGT